MTINPRDFNIMNLDVEKFSFEPPAQCLARWEPGIKAAKTDDDDVLNINIYSSIGEYGDGAGMTAKLMSALLRNSKAKDVVVNINSPGGDFFEGLAQYNLLKEYDGNVKVRVIGMAGSAASVIAMAGDEIEIAESAFFMIHSAWTLAIGNKDDMKEVMSMLQKFDDSMAKLYAKETGQDIEKINDMMDAETWVSADDAIEMGFASAILGADKVDVAESDKKDYNSSLRRVDLALAKSGMPRSERRALIKDLTGTPGAADNDKPGAVLNDALNRIYKTLTN